MVMTASNIALVLTRKSSSSLRELQQTVAFSCGYRAGQVGIQSRLPSLFTVSELKQTIGCRKYREIAVRHGFDMTDDPDTFTEQ